MDIGLTIPHYGQLASPDFVTTFSRSAESAGFDSLWTADHVVVPERFESDYLLRPTPQRYRFADVRATMGQNLEMNVTLAVAAAVTNRVKLCTGVAVLTIRNPILNARQIASIDLYSGGRILYGVGVGWLKEEAEAMSMPWDRRGRRVDEQIALLRTLWTASGDTVEFDGEFYRVPPMAPEPLPVQRPIPILIGGHSDAALERAARLGDGWIAAGMGPDRLKEAMDRLRGACDRVGRDLTELQIVNGERSDVTLDTSSPDLKNQARRAIDALEMYASMGVTHMKAGISARDAASTLEMVDFYGAEILPAFR
ncbi:MAG: LLM class F420-dependent oxidoreductase [Fimbriimonadales bacterium]